MAGRESGVSPQVALGRVLRSLREARGLTQEQLALESGYSGYYIRLLEGGRKNATVLALFHLGRVLGTTPSAMLRSTEQQELTIPMRQRDEADGE